MRAKNVIHARAGGCPRCPPFSAPACRCMRLSAAHPRADGLPGRVLFYRKHLPPSRAPRRAPRRSLSPRLPSPFLSDNQKPPLQLPRPKFVETRAGLAATATGLLIQVRGDGSVVWRGRRWDNCSACRTPGVDAAEQKYSGTPRAPWGVRSAHTRPRVGCRRTCITPSVPGFGISASSHMPPAAAHSSRRARLSLPDALSLPKKTPTPSTALRPRPARPGHPARGLVCVHPARHGRRPGVRVRPVPGGQGLVVDAAARAAPGQGRAAWRRGRRRRQPVRGRRHGGRWGGR
jgi:hypothetical protein